MQKFLSKFDLRKYLNLLLIALMLVFILSLLRSFRKVKKANQRILQEAEKVENLKIENQKLQEKIKEVQSDEYIEREIRDKLGLAKEGEIVVVMPEDDIVRQFAPKIEFEEDSLPDPNWKAWGKLFGILN